MKILPVFKFCYTFPDFEDDYVVFYNDSIMADFSQCPIEFDGKTFPTVEHCVKLQMLQSMGLLRLVDQLRKVENVDLFRRKLRESLTQAYKDDKIADEVAEDWLLKNIRIKLKRANRIKFSNNIDARKTLLNTGDKVLVFASKHDRMGGIGMTANKFIKFVRQNELRSDQFLSVIQSDKLRPGWLGHNWLGLVLMEIRAELNGKPVKFADSHVQDENLRELIKAIEKSEMERIREKQKKQFEKAAALAKQSAIPVEKPKKLQETGWALPSLSAEILQHLGAEEMLKKETREKIEEPETPIKQKVELPTLPEKILPEKISPEEEMRRVYADVRALLDLLVDAVHKAIPSVLIVEPPPKPTVERKPPAAFAPAPEATQKEFHAPIRTLAASLVAPPPSSTAKKQPVSLLSLFTNPSKPSSSWSSTPGPAQKS